jgi:hypothetical protein
LPAVLAELMIFKIKADNAFAPAHKIIF